MNDNVEIIGAAMDPRETRVAEPTILVDADTVASGGLHHLQRQLSADGGNLTEAVAENREDN